MTIKQAQTAANHILDDRSGADYYLDSGVLSSYIRSALGVADDVAEQTANQINDDRKGANYYADQDVLAKFLKSKMS